MTKKIKVDENCSVSVIVAYCDQDTAHKDIETSILKLSKATTKKQRDQVKAPMHLVGHIFDSHEPEF